MKNKLLIVLVFGAISFDSLMGLPVTNGSQMPNNPVSGALIEPSEIYHRLSKSELAQLRMQDKLGADVATKSYENSIKVGGRASYAPSEVENILSRFIGELENLRAALRKMRMDDYAMFQKYFGQIREEEMN